MFHDTVSHSRGKEYGVVRMTGGAVVEVDMSKVAGEEVVNDAIGAADANVTAFEVEEKAMTSSQHRCTLVRPTLSQAEEGGNGLPLSFEG